MGRLNGWPRPLDECVSQRRAQHVQQGAHQCRVESAKLGLALRTSLGWIRVPTVAAVTTSAVTTSACPTASATALTAALATATLTAALAAATLAASLTSPSSPWLLAAAALWQPAVQLPKGQGRV